MPTDQRKLGVILSYLAIVVNNVIGLLYTPYMLCMMGQNEYGLYSLIASVVGYLTILDLGFGNAIIRYTAKFRAENKKQEQYEMFGMFFCLYCVISLITLGIGAILYFRIDDLFGKTMSFSELYKIRIMTILLVINLAFTFPMSVWRAILTAYERFVFQRSINIARIILNTLVMIVLLTLGYRAIAMVAVLTFFNITTLICEAIYCFFKLKIKVRFMRINLAFLKEIIIYSFWVFLSAIMAQIYWSSGQFVLGIYSGTAAISVYALAVQLHSMFSNFSTAVSGVFLPRIVSMITKGNDEISDLFIKIGRLQYHIIIFLFIGFVLFGKEFIILWAGQEYAEAYIIAMIFLGALIIPLIQNIGILILQARNQQKFRGIILVTTAIVGLLLSFLLVENYGGVGCACGIGFSLLVGQGLILNLYYAKKMKIDILLFWKEIARISIAPIVLVVLGYVFKYNVEIENWESFGVSVLLFSSIYIPVICFTSLNLYEKELLSKPIQKIRYKLKLK